MQSSQSASTCNFSRNTVEVAAAQSTATDSDNVRQLGYEMGIFAAMYWPNVKDSERFRYMTIVDYREDGAATSASSLIDQAYSHDFINGFRMGFEDEAMDHAHLPGFEDVLAAGSVDGSVAVTARRLLKLLDGVRLRD